MNFIVIVNYKSDYRLPSEQAKQEKAMKKKELQSSEGRGAWTAHSKYLRNINIWVVCLSSEPGGIRGGGNWSGRRSRETQRSESRALLQTREEVYGTVIVCEVNIMRVLCRRCIGLFGKYNRIAGNQRTRLKTLKARICDTCITCWVWSSAWVTVTAKVMSWWNVEVPITVEVVERSERGVRCGKHGGSVQCVSRDVMNSQSSSVFAATNLWKIPDFF